MKSRPRDTAARLLALALILGASVVGCTKEAGNDKKTLLLITGWSVSPDFQKLVVPFWIGQLDGDTSPKARATKLETSYQYVVVFDLSAKGQFRFLPFNGDTPDAVPDYPSSFTSWSADSQKLFYYGGWRWNNGPRLWHPSRIDLKTEAAIKSDQVVDRDSKIYASPSGRYALIATSVNSMHGASILLWDTRAGTIRELLRSKDAPGWCPTEPVAAWDADETKIYVTVSSRSPAGGEVWQLCECPIDSQTTYTPATARVLWTLDNSSVHRPATEANCGIQFEADRNLAIADVSAVKHSLLLYRGDTHMYGRFDVASRQFEKLYFSPLLTTQEGGKVSLREEYLIWHWRDANVIAFVKENAQGEARLWVENPARPREAHEVLPGRTVTSRRIQWCGSDWLAYETLLAGPEKEKFPMREIRAVNVRTGEDRLLLSTDLQRQVLDEFSKNFKE